MNHPLLIEIDNAVGSIQPAKQKEDDYIGEPFLRST